MHHLLGQSVFDVVGVEAWGEAFFVMHAVVDGQTATGFGRYVDYFQRIHDAWKLVYGAWSSMRPFRATTAPPTGNRTAVVPTLAMTG